MRWIHDLSVRTKLWVLAGALLGLTLLVAGADLLSMGSMASAVREDLGDADRIMRTADLARQAQADFKTQVQDWKDMLIRGHDPEMMAKHRAGFEKAEGQVRTDLQSLKVLLGQVGLDPALAERSMAEHRILGDRYRAAIAQFKASDPLSYRVVDQQVQGMDRPMGVALGELAQRVIALTSGERDHQLREVQSRARPKSRVVHRGQLRKRNHQWCAFQSIGKHDNLDH